MTVPVRAILLLLLAVSLGAGGQVCLKIGVNELGGNASPLTVIKGIFTPYVLGGFMLYALSSVCYLYVLSRLDLSYAYPFVALSFVFVTLLSWRVLGEELPALRVVGLVLILAGVLTVAASYRNRPEASPEASVVEHSLEQHS